MSVGCNPFFRNPELQNDVLAFHVTKLAEPLSKRRPLMLARRQRTARDASDAKDLAGFSVLRVHRKRDCEKRARQRKESTPSRHSITRSARTRMKTRTVCVVLGSLLPPGRVCREVYA